MAGSPLDLSFSSAAGPASCGHDTEGAREADPPGPSPRDSKRENGGPAASVPPAEWADPDGGRWRIFASWADLPRGAGLLAVLVRHADGIVHEILEWHPARNLRATARSRLHAIAPSFVGSAAAQAGGSLAWGVLVPGKRRRRCSRTEL